MHVTMRQLKRIIQEELIREASAPAFAPTAAEEAVRVNSQVSGMVLQTDQSYWEEYGISTGEELALSLLSSTYSDMYKSIHGIRPRWEEFNSPAEAQAAIDALDQEVEDMIAADELEAQQQAEYEKKEKEIQALMPGEFDFQELPKQSGMGRRFHEDMGDFLGLGEDDADSVDEFILPGGPVDPGAFLHKDPKVDRVDPKKR